MEMMKSRKAISPVIATVILVAVAITIAVAVSYWMSGISGQYTKFEKVEITSAICTLDSTQDEWEIVLSLKNTGTSTATLTSVYINDVPVDTYGVATAGEGEATTNLPTAGLPIASGATGSVTLYIDSTGDAGEAAPVVAGTDYWQSVSSGTTVNIKLHSAGGMDYFKLIELV